MWTIFAVICTALALVGVPFLWLYFFNSERGERYMKQRIQGPFVPVHPDEQQNNQKTK